ncbi:MAG: SMP-30/gluconolactonase/LRE family protein [Flavobacteriales bacterium]|nr:SMP-30/gluconolactonase/LRE family protein [Flavobacteriales bacterium]
MKKLIILIGLVTTCVSAFAQLEEVFVTDGFASPESIVWDKSRNVFYVSNYHQNVENGTSYGDDYVSKVDVNGKIIELEWIKHLSAPTGVIVANDKLYIVERFGVVEYDLKTNKVTNRYCIQHNEFINDIVMAPDGSLFITEGWSDNLLRIKDGVLETWLSSKKIRNPNGLFCDGNKLIIGVNEDHKLKSIDIATKEITVIAEFEDGNLDGIKKYKDGYLVGNYYGQIFYVKQNGEITEWLNVKDKKIICADFEYIEEKQMLYVPDLDNSTLHGYKIVSK